MKYSGRLGSDHGNSVALTFAVIVAGMTKRPTINLTLHRYKRHPTPHTGSNNGAISISGTSTRPLSVIRISGMTESGMRLKPM